MENTIRIKTAIAVVTAMALLILPFYVFGARCYESRSMCDDIADLGTREIEIFPNPLFMDAESKDLVDTWGAARRNGNTHEGTDILADRGTYMVMPTDGVVDRTGVSGLGGKHVFIYIGGGEKLYFAHLDDWAPGLSEGDVLEKGDLVGYVGNTGATYTVPHLHLAIYENGVAENPYPRMKDTDWTLKEKMRHLDSIIDDARDEESEARKIFARHGDVIQEAIADDIRIPDLLEDLVEGKIKKEEDREVIESDIEEAQEFNLFEENIGVATDTSSSDIKRLQRFLRDVEDAAVRINGEFDDETEEAVKDFQEKYSTQVLDIWGLDRATGYVGITTRLKMNYLIQSGATSCPVFTEYNSLAQNVTGTEVRETQELLRELDLYNGKADGRFDLETHNAMIEFQEKFDATMLKPWGLIQGTGYKYKTTNKFMNYLRGCDTGEIQLEGRGSFDF